MGSLLIPFLITSAVLSVGHRYDPNGGDGGLFLLVSVFAGVACWSIAPIRETPKLVVGVAYVFLMGALQLGYAMSFVCGFYGRCP